LTFHLTFTYIFNLKLRFHLYNDRANQELQFKPAILQVDIVVVKLYRLQDRAFVVHMTRFATSIQIIHGYYG
jgi:hypothetical protein